MKVRRFTSLLLAITILFTLTVSCGLTVSAESALVMSDEGIEMIKSFEGFAEKPYWDVNQYTVGYGTYCPDSKYEEYKENGIPEEEADALLREHVAKYETVVNLFADKYGLEFAQHEFDALVSFTYNLGSGWVYTSGNFHKTMANPDATDAEILYWFGAHCTAGSTILSGLIRRRAAEVNLYLNGEYGTTRPSNYCYVKYNANGGTVAIRVNMYDTDSADRIEVTPTREGYIFDGWFTTATGGTQVTELNKSTHASTLYAHWTAEESTGEDKEEKEETDEEVEEETGEETGEETSLTVTVTSNDVNLRKGPGTNYTTIGTANKGKVYTITQIKEAGGRTWGCFGSGWICLDYTSYKNPVAEEEENETSATVTGKVKVTSYLTIRSGAGTGYSAVGTLSNNAKVEILQQKVVGASTWGKISKGWICMDYVVLDEAEEDTESKEETSTEDETGTTATKVEGTVTASSLLIRTGPGTSYDVAGSYKKGTKVTILQQKEVGSTTWGKTAKGWVSMAYISLSEASDETGTTDKTESTDKTETTGTKGIVKADGSLRIRSGPGTSYSVAGYVRDGSSVTITQTKVVGSTTWGKISKGWISLDYVELEGTTDTDDTDTRTVTASCLKVRAEAGTSSSVAGYLYYGAKVTILETKSVNGTSWGRIATGWICLDYTK